MTPGQGFESQPPPARAATRLSRRFTPAPGNTGLLRLAWRSLQCLSMATLVSSCIVAPPPEYTDPTQTRPELIGLAATPSIYQIVVIQTPSPTSPSFTVPVRSEDAGVQLAAFLFLDYGSPTQTLINSQFVPASTFNDTSDRKITMDWTAVGGVKDCHTVSVVVAHATSLVSPQILDPNKKSDWAIISWWVNVNPPADALYTLSNCPSPNPP